MRAVLQAISEELARLKAEGEQVVPVTEEALTGLRALVAAHVGGGGAASVASPQGRIAGSPVVAGAAGVRPSVSVPSLPTPPVRLAAAPTLPAPPVVVLPDENKAIRAAALRTLAEADPVNQARMQSGKKLVLGAGSLDARIFFVGDAPGVDEEAAGEPFVGAAGQLLNRMIGAMGLKREQVHISNILCWRPMAVDGTGAEDAGHRPPTAEEVAYCLPYLRALIEIVQPQMVVALGGVAAQGLLAKDFTTLPAARGRWHDWGGTPLMVTYHPSYLLRNGSNKSKRMVWEDLMQVMERASLPITEKQRAYFL